MQLPKIVEHPDHEPITLEEAKLHLRIEHELEDTPIGRMIRSARELAQELTSRTFVPTTYKLQLDGFPHVHRRGGWDRTTRIDDQVLEVLSVKYLDQAGELQEVDAENYRLVEGPPALVCPAPRFCWPRALCGPAAVEVEYVAGYASDDDIPTSVREWMLTRIGTLYEQREGVVPGVSVVELPDVDGLLDAARWGHY